LAYQYLTVKASKDPIDIEGSRLSIHSLSVGAQTASNVKSAVERYGGYISMSNFSSTTASFNTIRRGLVAMMDPLYSSGVPSALSVSKYRE
jgi:hypothetical protein